MIRGDSNNDKNAIFSYQLRLSKDCWYRIIVVRYK